MYSAAEQSAWRHAFEETRPRAVWLPHYPYPLARLLPGRRGMSLYVTVHDTIHLLPEAISGQSRARRAYARAMLKADAKGCRRIFTVSEATKVTLTEIEPSARVLVTPIPVDEVWLQPADPDLSPSRDVMCSTSETPSGTRTFRWCSRRSPVYATRFPTSW